MLAATFSPARILSMVSTPRIEPMRQGVHLPQLSTRARNSIAKRAIHDISTVSSNTTSPPWADQAVDLRVSLVVETSLEQRYRQIGAERAANLQRARTGPAPPETAPARRCQLTISFSGQAERRLDDSPPCL